MTREILGLTLGFVLGWSAIAGAQAIQSYVIDAKHAVCWDQPAASLAAANALKVRVTYDAQPTQPAALTCSGAASPFACNLTTTVPMSVQTVGRHRIVVEGAAVDPVDGSESAYATLINYEVDFRSVVSPPQPGSNGRLVKLAQAIAKALKGFWAWLT